MSFVEARKRVDDAVFRRFGEDATYVSVLGQHIAPVRVIRKEPDLESRFADSRAVLPTCTLRFRRSEIGSPAGGDRFIFDDPDGEVAYELHPDPVINSRRTIWTGGAEALDVAR